MKKFFLKWGHALMALYLFIHMPCFIYLESHVTDNYHLIHCALDDYIPFCEYFIIPYYFWFAFIAIACVYFFLRSQAECIRMGSYLIIGMLISVIIYFVYPNGLGDFRPHEFPRDNFCTDLVRGLYKTDTSTNVLPSLHVYNTLCVAIAVFKSKTFGKAHTPVKVITAALSLLICASTVFLKQHSLWDIAAAVALAAALYPLIYKWKFFASIGEKKSPKEDRETAL